VKDGGFLMANFVDFDTLYGHRRDPVGYGKLLEEFDAMLPLVFARLQTGDRLILTADHGNDPTWTGTDHTRERIPIMMFGSGITPGYIGGRESFSDLGQAVAKYLGVELRAGTAFSL
jgi:phosphopentomutase